MYVEMYVCILQYMLMHVAHSMLYSLAFGGIFRKNTRSRQVLP